jgi:hypothetical protein
MEKKPQDKMAQFSFEEKYHALVKVTKKSLWLHHSLEEMGCQM